MSDSQHKRPLWLGALCSILAPPVLLVLVALLSQSRMPSAARLLSGVGGLFYIATPVSFLATMCLGLPLVLLLRSLKALTWISICFGATVIGAASFALFSWLITWHHQAPNLFQYLLGASLGLVSGAAFCVGVGPNSSFKSNREDARA
jgi:hypothetical protein